VKIFLINVNCCCIKFCIASKCTFVEYASESNAVVPSADWSRLRCFMKNQCTTKAKTNVKTFLNIHKDTMYRIYIYIQVYFGSVQVLSRYDPVPKYGKTGEKTNIFKYLMNRNCAICLICKHPQVNWSLVIPCSKPKQAFPQVNNVAHESRSLLFCFFFFILELDFIFIWQYNILYVNANIFFVLVHHSCVSLMHICVLFFKNFYGHLLMFQTSLDLFFV
jgi:hypothetical protein